MPTPAITRTLLIFTIARSPRASRGTTIKCASPYGAGALSRMAGRLIATILENLESAAGLADQVDDHPFFHVGRLQSVFEILWTIDFSAVDLADKVSRTDARPFCRTC